MLDVPNNNNNNNNVNDTNNDGRTANQIIQKQGKLKLLEISLYGKKKVILNIENRTCQVIDMVTLGDNRVKPKNRIKKNKENLNEK